MARGRYTDEDKARVLAALAANEGNVKRTARDTQIPEQTVRDWKKQSERGSLPEKVKQALPAALEVQATDFERIRNKALYQLESEIDAGELSGKELITAIGVLTDKLRVMQGQATSRTETVHTGPSAEEVGAEVAKFLQQSFSHALNHEAEVVDAEFVEQAALPGDSTPAPAS